LVAGFRTLFRPAVGCSRFSKTAGWPGFSAAVQRRAKDGGLMLLKRKMRCRKCGYDDFNYSHPSGWPRCGVCGAFAYSRNLPKLRARRLSQYWAILPMAAMFALAGYFWWEQGRGDSRTNCTIKGNISFSTGERIYHLPGDKYYETTRINFASGERWFCSEAEARAAGWRRSKR
jgi:rubredoxin